MADSFFKVKNGLTIVPIDPSTLVNPENGDLVVDSTDSNKLKKYNASVSKWQEISGSGSGAKNYLTAYTASTSSGVPNTGNGDIEGGSTLGFSLGTVALTSNFPSGSPTFGSGASGNLSLSVISGGTQLAKNYSLGLVSSAATTAGNFVATDAFFVDLEDQAKIMTFSFSYLATVNPSNGNFSGTSANSFAVAVWDVTNSAWIQPAGVFNLVQSAGVGLATGTFQTTSNSTQYRLVVYNANASAGAITMYLDDFSVGPQTIQKGAAMSDTQSYAPIYAGMGTVTNNSVSWRRVGDCLEVQGNVTLGTTSTTQALISLPSGLQIDSSKITSSSYSVVGYLEGETDITTTYTHTILAKGGQSSVSVGMRYGAGSHTPLIPENANGILSTGVNYSFFFSVPILGWSSNTVMSQDTDTRVVAFSGSLSANSSNSSGTYDFAPISISGAVNGDTHSAMNLTSGVYTIPVSGWYRVGASAYLSSPSTNCFTSLTLTDSSNNFLGAIASGATASVGPGTDGGVSGSTVFKLNAGQTIKIRINKNSTGIIYAGSSVISIERLSGPATIAASETVAASYQDNSGQSIHSTRVITFNTKILDTHGAFDPSTGQFKAPVSGIYEASLGLFSYNANSGWVVHVRVNSVAISEATGAVNYASTNQMYVSMASPLFRLNAGDIVDVQNVAPTTGAGALNTALINNWFSIKKVGN